MFYVCVVLVLHFITYILVPGTTSYKCCISFNQGRPVRALGDA